LLACGAAVGGLFAAKVVIDMFKDYIKKGLGYVVIVIALTFVLRGYERGNVREVSLLFVRGFFTFCFVLSLGFGFWVLGLGLFLFPIVVALLLFIFSYRQWRKEREEAAEKEALLERGYSEEQPFEKRTNESTSLMGGGSGSLSSSQHSTLAPPQSYSTPNSYSNHEGVNLTINTSSLLDGMPTLIIISFV
jgi:hypothetical protein